MSTSQIMPRLILISIILFSAIIIMVIDSTIVIVYLNISEEPPMSYNLALFIGSVCFFGLTSYVLISFSLHGNTIPSIGSRSQHRPFGLLIIIIQSVLCALLAFLCFQTVFYKMYNLSVISIIVMISHIAAMFLTGFLSYQLIRWFKAKRNYVVLLYGIAFSIIVLNLIVSVLYIMLEFTYYDPVIKMRSIKRAVYDSSIPTINLLTLGTLYNYISTASFILTWIPTVIMLKSYSTKFGNVKFWTLMAVPIIYFLLPSVVDHFGIFDSLRMMYGKTINIIYNLFFSPYQQIGGLLFGLAFLTTATKIKRYGVQILLLTSGAGMILLFGSTVIHGFTYIVFPPFGVLTVSFVALASYMLLIGILTSSKEVARDVALRREIYRAAEKQLDVFKDMGLAQAEKMLEKKIKPVIERVDLIQNEEYGSNLEKSELNQLLREVLDEVKSRKSKTTDKQE